VMTINICIFWDVTPCRLVIISVSEEHSASMFKMPPWKTGYLQEKENGSDAVRGSHGGD
jgi:hypothetical protein